MAYASVDIAELSVLIGLPIEIDDNVHTINVKCNDTITEETFKNMFYKDWSSKLDPNFQLAPTYTNPPTKEDILGSNWGRVAEDKLYGNIDATGKNYVLNFNRLGGFNFDVPDVISPYVFTTEPSEHFFAQENVIDHWETDLGFTRIHWTVGSRISIEEALRCLAFSPEVGVGPLTIIFTRNWNDAIRELTTEYNQSLTSAGVPFDPNYGYFYINIRVKNGNTITQDCLIRIKFLVQLDTPLESY